jgi:hypothetical protein
MNWITTNIRFPEDLYIELKMEALKRRESVAGIVRKAVEKIIYKEKQEDKRRGEELLKEIDRIAKRNAKVLKGISLSEELIKMRYEQ